MKKRNILITGSAGFIGMHLSLRLCSEGINVFGLDSINDYYSTSLKYDRIKKAVDSGLTFFQGDLADEELLECIIKKHCIDTVIHLAAQAGVRYSVENPKKYVDTNIVGFFNVLNCCKKNGIKNFYYASSSSVYGNPECDKFSENISTDCPQSLYAASKKCNEVIAESYANLYGMNIVGLRFFTVYGPWGRPDQSLYIFTKAILEGREIMVFNNGELYRDFTYIDDIVEGITKLLTKFSNRNDIAGHNIYNIGKGRPIKLDMFIDLIESKIGLKAFRKQTDMQKGDVYKTCANIEKLSKEISFVPETSEDIGVSRYLEWHLSYYK